MTLPDIASRERQALPGPIPLGRNKGDPPEMWIRRKDEYDD